YRNGNWTRLYRVVDEDDAREISEEIARQFEAFERLVGRPPTHIDSHQHAHLNEPARSIVIELARRYGVPVRSLTPSVTYCGRFYGQDDHGASWPELIAVDGLLAILANLGPGVTEIGCHPATVADLDTMYRSERLIELMTLCDPRVQRAV